MIVLNSTSFMITALFDGHSSSSFSILSRFFSGTEINSAFSNHLISLTMLEYCFLCSTLWLLFSEETGFFFKSSRQVKQADHLISVAFSDTAWFWLTNSKFVSKSVTNLKDLLAILINNLHISQHILERTFTLYAAFMNLLKRIKLIVLINVLIYLKQTTMAPNN